MTKIKFTGERMIPWQNKGKALYYEHLLRYFFAGAFVKEKTVLDLGCGSGYGSYILALSGAKKVTGVDLSGEAIADARKNFKTTKIELVKDNVLNLSGLRKKFDVVVAFEILEHLREQRRLLSKAKSKLKKGGLFIVSTPNKINYPKGNPFHQRELTLSEFKDLLKSRFKYVQLLNQYFVLSNIILPSSSYGETVNFNFDEFVKTNSKLFHPRLKAINAQYFLAICSDQKVVGIDPYVISTPKVDNIDFTEGPALTDNKIIENAEDKELIHNLNELRFSKIFKIWQALVRIRQKCARLFQ